VDHGDVHRDRQDDDDRCRGDGAEKEGEAEQGRGMGQGDRVPGPPVGTDRDEGRRRHRGIRRPTADPHEEGEAPHEARQADDQQDQSDPADRRRPGGNPEEAVDRQAGPGNPDVEQNEEH